MCFGGDRDYVFDAGDPKMQIQNMTASRLADLKPMATTSEDWESIDLPASLPIAIMVHRLTVPIFVVLAWLDARFSVFEKRPRKHVVNSGIRAIFYLLPTPVKVSSTEIFVSRK